MDKKPDNIETMILPGVLCHVTFDPRPPLEGHYIDLQVKVITMLHRALKLKSCFFTAISCSANMKA